MFTDGMTACQCPISGYCSRHAVHKSDHWHMLCKTREDYRKIWDEGRGPGQAAQKAVTQPKEISTKKSCSACEQRRQLLNRIVPGLGDAVKTAIETVMPQKK